MSRSQQNRWARWRIAADEAISRMQRAMLAAPGSRICDRRHPTPHVDDLEPRILFSATPIDPGSLLAGDQAAMVVEVDSSTLPDSDLPTIETLAQVADSKQSTDEIIIIDSAVPDLQQLLDDLQTSIGHDDVFVLDASRDGIDQITEILDARSEVSSLHIVSHAQQGSVKLGNVWLGQSNVIGYAGQIASWQTRLTADADILFYGCDLAGSSSGQTMLESIRALSAADVAASIDDTGHTNYGGDWELEYSAGAIESNLIFSSQLQQNWQHKLATITVDTFDDIIDGGDGLTSLREAISITNAGGGGDTIELAAGDYTLTIDSLHVFQDVTINGANARTSLIDAAGLSKRAFHLHDTSVVTISGVTIQGGNESNGGGIFVDDTSTLNLANATLTNNTSDKGGAIYVRGTANLDSVLLHNNSAVDGGAIHFHGAVDGSLTNVTISGNTASNSGGGLWTDSTVSVINSTITLNDATDAGGIHNKAGTVNISNTIVAGNTATNADQDVLGSFNSNGFNLIEVVGSAAGFGGDMLAVSANLDGLANNGGQTDTHALLAGSPAINRPGLTGAPPTDQRGQARDGSPDIGAFEFSMATVADNFDDGAGGSSVYSGNDGSQDWVGDWIENDDAANRIEVVDKNGGGDWRLMVRGDSSSQGHWISRQANLSGSTTAVLTFDYEMVDHLDATFQVDLRDGDTDWTNVVTYNPIGDQLGYEAIVIAANLRDNGLTEIRFRSSPFSQADFWYLDNVQIEHDASVSNSAPIDINPNSFQIDENIDTSGGYSVGTLTTSDLDLGDTFSYSIQAGGDGALFSIGGSNGDELILDDGLLDFEAKSSYTVNVRVTDSAMNTYGESVTVNVNDVNEAPVVTASSGILTYTENDPATPIDPGLIVTDPDDGNLVSAQVRIAIAYASGQDILEFTDQLGISGTWDSGSGILTLSGSSTVANYQTALRSVAYRNSSEDPDQTTRTVSFQVSDGQISSGGAKNIDVTAVNDRPVVSGVAGDSLSYTGGSAAKVIEQLSDVTVGDVDSTDLGLGNLKVAIVAGGHNSEDVLSIRDQGMSAGQIAFDGSNVFYGGVLIGTATGGTNGTPLVISFNPSSTPIASAALIRNITYENLDKVTPKPGDRTVRFVVDDGDGDTSLDSDATVTVSAANSPPTEITPNILSIDENVDTTGGISLGQLSATDADLDETFTWSIVGGVDQSKFTIVADQLMLDDGVLDFEAQASYSVRVRVTDSAGNPYEETLAVNVSDRNDNLPKVDAGQSLGVSEFASIGTSLGFVTATDADDGTVFSNWIISSGNGDGIFSIDSSSGELQVINNTNLNHEITDSYLLGITVSDGLNTSLVQTVNINVIDQNDAPSGLPVITGTVREDETLVADTTAIGDEDGLGTVNYQWLRNGNTILAATNSTYVVGDDDVGQLLSIAVSYIDNRGTVEGPLLSVPTAPVMNVNDLPTGLPSILGVAEEDETLTADVSAISDEDGVGSISHQWLRNGATISGATGSTYTLGDDDVNQLISVQVFYVDGYGTFEGPLTSTQTGSVSNINDLPSGSVTISGIVAEDELLTATHSLSDDDGLGIVSYQWHRNGLAITGATSSTYTLGDQDVGAVITAAARYTDGQGTDEGVFSSPTAVVSNVNDNPTVANAIANQHAVEAVVFKFTLPVNTFADVDGDTLSYSAILPDGNPLPNWLGFDAGTRTFFGTPLSDDLGVITIRVIAEDGNSATAVAEFVLSVIETQAPPPATIPANVIPTSTDDDQEDDDVLAPQAAAEYLLSGAPAPLPKRSTPDISAAPTRTQIPGPTQTVIQAISAEQPLAAAIVTDLIFEDPEAAEDVSSEVTASRSDNNGIDELRSRINNIYQVRAHDPQWKGLDVFRDDVLGDWSFQTLVVGAAVSASVSLSVGYVFWTVRGGWLASALMTSMPVWRSIDPLPVLEYLNGDLEQADDESLQSIIQQQSEHQPETAVSQPSQYPL